MKRQFVCRASAFESEACDHLGILAPRSQRETKRQLSASEIKLNPPERQNEIERRRIQGCRISTVFLALDREDLAAGLFLKFGSQKLFFLQNI